jgi:protein O-GlcNAc transferase
MNRIEEAAACFVEALRLKPDYAEAHYKLGNAVKIQGKLDEALVCYQKARSFNPDYAEAHNNEGAVYQERRQWNEAIASYRAALAINPGLSYAHYNLGLLLLLAAQDRFIGDAVASLRKAVSLSPDFMDARSQLGTALGMLGRHDEASAVFRQALSISPDFMEARSNLLFYLSHDPGVSPEEVFAEHRAFGDRFEVQFRDHRPNYRNLPDPARTLRVGFVSADLRAHAVCSFIEPLWAGLDSKLVELWAYSNSGLEDEVTVRLKSLVHQWRNVAAMSDEELADQIRKDGIDILFDLSGHSGGNRLLTFARKPAPIQVSWIGYPNTTGLKAIDYFLADRFSALPGLLDSLFTEKIVRLPTWASFRPFGEAPAVNGLPALASGVLTFGSFSRGDKLAEGVVALWSRVLNAIPGSRMLLGGVSDASRQENLADQFARNGVDRGRVIFHARAGMPEYLALHHQVDMILDTFPFGGFTVSCHAAWMGVPVLTLAGKTMPSRLGFSMNSNIGLPEFIAESEDAFVTQAVQWSRRLPELAALRAGLRSRMLASPLCRTQAFARWLELALRIMWGRWCDKKPAESFGIDP